MNWRQSFGYSLIEAVTAMALFALVAAVLLGAFGRAMQLWEAGRRRSEALTNVRMAVAWLGQDARIASSASFCSTATDCTFTAPDGTRTEYTFDGSSGVLSRTVSGQSVPVAAGLSQVSMSIDTGTQHRTLMVQMQADLPSMMGAWNFQVSYALRNS